ncbi:MAG: type II toxin-antitoxin system prevent-host-death family antitoxin [Spirochaetota bacterium]|nr:type II toxin-antitoxin system prevent-host-death family antitoxin [Spirochaetota bacterium]
MQKVKLKDAQNKLTELIDKVADGEEVFITREDGSAFKIIPFTQNNLHPKFGSAKGLIQMSDDFDEPLEDFKEYQP